MYGRSYISLLITVAIIGIIAVNYYKSDRGKQVVNGQAIKKAHAAANTAEKTSIIMAIQNYRMENETNPESLKELVEKGYIPEAACKDENGKWYEYEVSTGKVK